jgi:hypothetical protein
MNLMNLMKACRHLKLNLLKKNTQTTFKSQPHIMPNILHGVSGSSPVFVSAAMTHVVCDNSTNDVELVLPQLDEGREIMVCKKSTNFAVTVSVSSNDRVNGKQRQELKSTKGDAWFSIKRTPAQWVVAAAQAPSR